MSTDPPGLEQLPLALRLKVRLLAQLQRRLDRFPHGNTPDAGGPRWLSQTLASSALDPLKNWAAPLRLGGPNPHAWLPPSLSFPAHSRSHAARHASVGVVVPIYGSGTIAARCLGSLEAFTALDYELVIVDDATPGGPPAPVLDFITAHPRTRLLRHARNQGFPTAVNRGVRSLETDHVVILNSDVVVSPGWLNALLEAAADPSVGIVAPLTNDSGDAATIDCSYRTLDEFLAFAEGCSVQSRVVPKVSLACALLRRSVFDAVGGLDEGYGRGMFDDDDLCAALGRDGLRCVIHGGVFVHHSAGSSFRKLAPLEYFARFHANRLRYERKWGVRWTPPRRG